MAPRNMFSASRRSCWRSDTSSASRVRHLGARQGWAGDACCACDKPTSAGSPAFAEENSTSAVAKHKNAGNTGFPPHREMESQVR